MPNKSKTPANAKGVGQPKREASLAAPNGYAAADVLEALKECEYALQQVLRNGKVGWLQEEAHKTACAVLTAQKQRRHTTDPSDPAHKTP